MNIALRRILAGFLVLAIGIAAGDAFAQKKPPKRSFTKITGDLYRAQNNFHFSVVLDTKDGVIVTDPVNAKFAAWVKAEVKKRFNKPIKYLILSHDHRDHIAGGEVFADTATVIAHENTRATIIAEKRPTAVPGLTFANSMTVELGGKTVELTYVGPSHSNGMIVMNFTNERTIYIVDIFTKGRVGYKGLGDSYWPGWINALKKVEGMDFDKLAPGHGAMSTRADLVAQRTYFEDLYSAVLQGARAGKSLAELQGSIKLEKYKSLGMYDKWFKLNIEGIYKRVTLQRRGN
ncbi:MAG: MBL fold metallo-hydrolase [Rhodospirillaceae bacterium]|jgi:glyoxylase-like metal-dependent hydrolase (beta-lactamase superfamily II)|nr:MBL fold metallo-hydrolase [Rhodospirillales bacterium]MBT3904451.1 MBL fold metallo-hydrolase [Rhodospirillaceae bacterium]MBT4701183.1 MBL fold metallo-hydrolase [Rhodospirillaceae bacterium]MBT5034187.1 MBL fold metallo-hydrolase [Rhodospirillaceae bacterium]MBT6220001.1 MBL fold metallo-hydrolase [Rhodospirillaceae bacterium]